MDRNKDHNLGLILNWETTNVAEKGVQCLTNDYVEEI